MHLWLPPQGGVFGAVADSAAFIAVVSALPAALPHAPAAANGAPAPPSVGVKAEPYEYALPVGATALIMIDFQRDFMEAGGFGAALGNPIDLLTVREWHAGVGVREGGGGGCGWGGG